MTILAFDHETDLIAKGNQAPRIACTSFASPDLGSSLLPTPGAHSAILGCLSDRTIVWVGHNVAFDLACTVQHTPGARDLVFEAYADGRVLDTMIIERIAEIGGLTPRKKLSLDILHAAHGFGTLPKDQEVRCSYGPLINRPLSDYSPAQISYARDDADATLKVFLRQMKRWIDTSKIHLEDVQWLCRKQFALKLVESWGLMTDLSRIGVLRRETLAQVAQLQEAAQLALPLPGEVLPTEGDLDPYRIVRLKKTRRKRETGDIWLPSVNKKRLQQWVNVGYDGKPPMTRAPKNRKSTKPFVPQISTSKATLEESGHPLLELFAGYGGLSAVANKDLPMLESGLIHTHFGIADSTRTTSAAPNVQNFRRDVGIRECVIPAPGYCFVSADHGRVEVATLGQVCWTNLGLRRLVDSINAGVDQHCLVAAEMLGISYEEAVRLRDLEDDAFSIHRNCAKVVNFGRPGGMSAETLVLFAKVSHGVTFDPDPRKALEIARKLVASWNKANPDGMAFLQWIKTLPKDREGRFSFRIPGTTITRRGSTYCSAANMHFQGLAARLEAEILWELQRESYTGVTPEGKASPLRFARMVNFIHDEFIFETPIGLQTEVAERLEHVMITSPRRFLPDVKLTADAKAMDRWSKKAKRVVKDGELLIYQVAA